jgi:type II secretory ATPase GspE/PulE/Tfp pilus assembly ATPase PilB-like protein
MNLPGIDIEKILLAGNYVTKQDLDTAKLEAKTNQTDTLDYLLSHGVLTRQLLGQAVAESFGVAFQDLENKPPSGDLVVKIPEEIATKLRIVISEESETGVVVATDNPKMRGLSPILKKLFPNKNVSITYALPDAIVPLFIYYRPPLQTRIQNILQIGEKVALHVNDEVFEDALIYGVSDIHYEPHDDHVVIRFRIDGVLREVARLPKQYYDNICNRIKVEARLRTDEHRLPQDGSLRHEVRGETVNMRVSITPTLDGEKIVIRLLSHYIHDLSLHDLGLAETNQQTLITAAKQPFGMILVVGPTGSGKTTTLYALLQSIDRPEVNITTIEDPVEYKINTANQIQVDTKTDLTFAAGLRSILRQDPDIVLVGEIRDRETAEIAVNAALTGHLLFSTFHANDAATAIPRLLDIGVEPFLIASTLELIIAQRLVRKICESCKVSVQIEPSVLKKFLPNANTYFPNKTITLYQGKGCRSCQNTGFKGRTAVFEFIRVTPEMELLITTRASSQEITKLALQQGSKHMFDDGIEKVKNGITTLEELLRVVPTPQYIATQQSLSSRSESGR